MRRPLYYTFGNHMHWVDMEWLWGYHVLPGSVRDMISLCSEAGVKGCVNFDGIGYEKLAAEDPEALLELREAVQEGLIEPVGCSYGQPYGLFHGGESNVRQLIYGARACRRLLGVWPKTFWEEEFYFFPQLPQMLSLCGFDGASLFFQWTWHTPEIPREDSPVIWWEGLDGTRILAATRNKLNMHQWPEDMDAVLSELPLSANDRVAGRGLGAGVDGSPSPLIQQWLELMPSPDWMCRSELILPKLKELLADPRFEVKPVTLGEYLKSVASASGGIGVPPMVSGPVASASSPMVSSGVSPESEKEIDKRQGAYLPHWRRDGATYAVTFRLADSLPKEVQAEYAAERQRLQELHDAGRLTSDALRYEYMRLRSEKVESYLDAGHGTCILREPAVGQVVYDALRHFDGDRYALAAAVVMPNHVHAVLQPLDGHDLGEILHSWKSFTSHKIGRGPIWQLESYDHLIRDRSDLARQIRYVQENPPRSGLQGWPWIHVDESVLHERDAHVNHRRDADATGTIPVRHYTMDQVWHGLTLGKNGDRVRRRSRETEQLLQCIESLAAVFGLFGRPYAQWDVYPLWELEELWRDLLWTQHHDVDECEGLCGHVADAEIEGLYQKVMRLLGHHQKLLADDGEWQVFNPHGWEVDGVGPYGFGVRRGTADGVWHANDDFTIATCSWDGFFASVDLDQAELTELRLETGRNLLRSPMSLVPSRIGGSVIKNVEVGVSDSSIDVRAIVDGESFVAFVMALPGKGLNVLSSRQRKTGEASGYRGAHRFEYDLDLEDVCATVDTPYAAVEVFGESKGVRKYPEGDWMTSPQWFEDVSGGLTGTSFVAFREGGSGRGLLVSQSAATQWFRVGTKFQQVVAAYDPWDEACYQDEDNSVFALRPLEGESNAECWKIANRGKEPYGVPAPAFPLTLSCSPDNVVVTAFYREAEDFAGKHVDNYAGRGIGYPFILRLVEFDGIESDVELTIVGPVAKAYKTNLIGQIECEVPVVGAGSSEVTSRARTDPHPTAPSPEGRGGLSFQYDTLRFKMRAHEIATLYLDIVPGRKQTRDLDAKREIWATVHRSDD